MKPFLEDNLNSNEMWKQKKKYGPKKVSSLPAAKLNLHGRPLTGENELDELCIENFTHILRQRPIMPGLEMLKVLKDELCHRHLQLVEMEEYDDWKAENLDHVLNLLKKNKNKDPYGLIYEIFKHEVIKMI